MNRALALVLISAAFSAVPARANGQDADALSISVEGYHSSVKGGDQQAVMMFTPGIQIGQVTRAIFSVGGDRCFGVSGRSLDPPAPGEWAVEVTPLRVEKDAVTFRLLWSRSRLAPTDPSPRSGDSEVTLRPGQTMFIDSMEVPSVPRCVFSTRKILKVKLDYAADPRSDESLVESELWLVERQASGVERSWPLRLRGRFTQPTSFFFDSVTDGDASLDIYGELRVFRAANGLRLALETYSRVKTLTGTSIDLSFGNGMFGARKVSSEVRARQTDVVSVELPRLGENASGAFAGRTFSIRIRTRQLR